MNLSSCLEAERVLVNGRFIVTQAVVACLNVCGIVLCVYVTALIAISQVLHLNLRILLVNLSALLCLRSALTLNRSTVSIFEAFTYKNSCDLVKEAESCKAYSAIAAAPYESLVFAFIGISIERCLATIAYKHYEKWKFPFAAVVLAPITWINIALIISKSIGKKMPERVLYRPYCSTVTTGYVDFSKLFNYNIPVIIVSFLLFLAVYIICKRKLRLFIASKIDDLSSRYQLVENVKSTKVLAILSSIYTVLVLLTLGAVVAISYMHITDLAEFAIIKEISSFSMPIYINVHSIVFLTQCQHIRLRAVRLFRRRPFTERKMGTSVAPVMSAKQHMDLLEQMWSTANK
ncbi:Serpentine receptor class alpha/beta-14 [Toxocara canis]|uniref:Serpentine receptor class alpha/beta-14 n=1 Tax=Toxocara canis TaxID=6265 RepID=A0A0B2UY64_TOXCA|nr:Serpentine receptor class alpha/beta-14 [Toxocara canis]